MDTSANFVITTHPLTLLSLLSSPTAARRWTKDLAVLT